MVLNQFPQAPAPPKCCHVSCGSGDSGVREVAVQTHLSLPEVAEGLPALSRIRPAPCPGFARATSRVRPGLIPRWSTRVIRETERSLA